MRPPTRSTRQLLLRAPEPADADALFAIQGDAEAMRFTFCAPERAATAAFLASYERRGDLDGFAPWVAQLAEVGAFVMPENRASVRVLEKAGFARTRFVPELARDEYRRPAK